MLILCLFRLSATLSGHIRPPLPWGYRLLLVRPFPEQTVVAMSDTFLFVTLERAADSHQLSANYAKIASHMSPLARRLLVGDLKLADVDDVQSLARDLLEDLQHDGDRHDVASQQCRGVLIDPLALSSTACASLRAAVDAATFENHDTVDNELEYQLTLDSNDLAKYIGEKERDHLFSVAARGYAQLVAPDLLEAAEAVPEWHAAGFEPMPLALGDPHYIMIRRYSSATRPWFPFHFDGSILSMNVALNDDSEYRGGTLLAILHDEVRAFPRAEGTALVHSSALLHAVTCMREGVRYTLIVFFGHKCPRAVHRMVLCEPSVMTRLYGQQYDDGYHCDRCGLHCAELDEPEQMWHCAHWCEYDVCTTCHAEMALELAEEDPT